MGSLPKGHKSVAQRHRGIAEWIALLTGVALLASASTIYGRVVPLGPAVQVNTGPTSDDASPLMVALPDGGFVVVWGAPGGAPFLPPVAGRRFDVSGRSVGSEFLLQDVLGVPPIIAADPGLVVGFHVLTDGVVLAGFTPDGKLLSAQPAAAIGNTEGGMSLTATPQNDVLAVWSDTVQVFAQRFDVALHESSPAVVITSAADLDFVNGVAGASNSQDSLIVWWDETYSEIQGRLVDAANMPIGDTFGIAGSVGQPGVPTLCADSNDGFLVAWGDDDFTGGLQRYDAQGDPVGPRLTTGLLSSPSLACLPEGNIVVVGLAQLYASPVSVVGRAFDVHDRPLGQFVIPTSLRSWPPTIAALPDDAFVAVWTTCVGSLRTNCDIFAQQFGVRPGPDCVGDCNGDGTVTIDELMVAVNLALGVEPFEECRDITSCPAIDTDLDCQVTVAEIVAAVNRALEGCE
jgi:hypothetical protein